MTCRVVEGRRFGIGLNALGHLPQRVVAIVDVADAVQPPQLEWALSQTASGPDPSKARIWPSPLGLMLSYAHAPWSPLCQEAHSKPFWVPIFQPTPGARSYYAAGRSAERWSATGTAVPIIVS